MKSAPHIRLALTAVEAFPELERLFLAAKTEISAGFRIFDPTTRLISSDARAHGDTWADLIAHTLQRGVSIRLILSDFDPAIRPALHRQTWQSVNAWNAAAERVGACDRFDVTAAMHDARVGSIPRTILWPRVRREVQGTLDRLNDMATADASAAINEMPGLAPLVRGEHGKYRVRRWPPAALVPATHHQKLAVFDRATLFIGGLDINNRRYDTPEHDRSADATWHDLSVITDGPAAQDAHRHLETMLDTIKGAAPVKTGPAFLRTLSQQRVVDIARMSPHPKLSEISDRTRDAIRNARDFIYLESQFLRDPDMANTLAAAAKARPNLQLLVVLPAAPADAAFDGAASRDVRYGEYLQAKCIKRVKQAFGNRAYIMAPAQNRRGDATGRGAHMDAPIIYIHAKLSVFDADSCIVSSANLNGRSARWDTEAGLWIDTPDDVARIRDRCMRHWLPDNPDDALLDPKSAVAAWRALGQSNATKAPPDRQGFVLPFPLRTTRRFGKNLPGVPAEMV